MSERETISAIEYGWQLSCFMKTLRPSAPREPCKRDYYVEEKLFSCSHVFVQNDAAKTSLHRTYTEPYRVLHRNDKYFTLEMGANPYDNVTINRLKACSLLMHLRDLPQDPTRQDTTVREYNGSFLEPTSNSALVVVLQITGSRMDSLPKIADDLSPFDEPKSV